MITKCYKCYRPIKTCYCKYIEPFEPNIKFVFLMHPKEAYKQKTGTGRLASLTIVNSEIIIDETFDNNIRVQELINSPEYFPMVLYPDEDAHFAQTFDFKKYGEDRELLIFLIDATWSFAKKMITRSPSLLNLPKLSFKKEYRSAFEIKKQPANFCLSTIESTYFLIKELQESGVCNKDINPDGLISIFRQMVKLQQTYKNNKMKKAH
ncbi:MAG: DTW domain-containing protein [Spirochaetaceae bacterium]